jgi:ABC-type Fe3+/spermidine/putrescine transport system ATPase subunit
VTKVMNSAFLQLVEVTKRHGDQEVVNRVSLDVAEGEILALLGASGCGKTTTLRLIAGLETPDEGEIWIEGARVASAGRNLVPPRARGIGFVFQDLALWPHLSVASSLDFVLASGGFPKRERAKRIIEVLRLVRIEPLAGRYPQQLSGGEQQRAALARALVGQPRLLLLDEPMSNLDDDLKAELLIELASLQRSLGVTTMYVTHGRSEAATLAQRIVFMREGCVVRMSTVDLEASGEQINQRHKGGY